MTTRATRMRLRRIAAGLTQLDVAQQSRISAGRVSLLERGIVPPSDAEREAIASVLGVDASGLFAAVDPVAV